MGIYGLTPKGEESYELAERYGFAEFYQFEVGNIIIPETNFLRVANQALKLIRENDWILGYEEGYYYITEAEEFQNW